MNAVLNGKKMMAEMIATYEGPPSTPAAKPSLNEVSPLTAAPSAPQS